MFIGNARLFTKFLFTIFVPLAPPPSQPAKWWISSWTSIKRTSNRIASTQPKLRTNPPKIANKQNYEQTGVSEFMCFFALERRSKVLNWALKHPNRHLNWASIGATDVAFKSQFSTQKHTNFRVLRNNHHWNAAEKTPELETDLASRWESVRLPRASGKSPDFPRTFPNFPGSFSATSPEVLSLWNFTAIQGFPGSFPDFPGGQPLSLGSLTPSPDSQKLSLTKISVILASSTRNVLKGVCNPTGPHGEKKNNNKKIKKITSFKLGTEAPKSASNRASKCPKHLLWLSLASEVLSYVPCKVIFKSARKIPLKTTLGSFEAIFRI